jgi:predicted nuclease of predicted toxin-antitoxin system
MRLLANENFPRVIVGTSRAGGHDVAWIREDARGPPDADVPARARHESVATFDRDFGESAFGPKLPATCGVILMGIVGPPQTQVRVVRDALASQRDRAGVFATVTNAALRIRPLPDPRR